MQKTVCNLVEGKWVKIQRFWLTLKKWPNFFALSWNLIIETLLLKIARGAISQKIQTSNVYILTDPDVLNMAHPETSSKVVGV